jgi:hypothetical protein
MTPRRTTIAGLPINISEKKMCNRNPLFFAVVVAPMFLAATPVSAGEKDVNIVNMPDVIVANDAAQPVPVSGAVSISAPVDVSGSTVKLDTSQPIVVSEASQEGRIMVQLSGFFPGGLLPTTIPFDTSCDGGDGAFVVQRPSPSGLIQLLYLIPSDSKYVISSISVRVVGAAASQSLLFSLRRGSPGNNAFVGRIETDAAGNGSTLANLTPGFESYEDLCFVPPPSISASIDLYGYIVPR